MRKLYGIQHGMSADCEPHNNIFKYGQQVTGFGRPQVNRIPRHNSSIQANIRRVFAIKKKESIKR